MSARLLFKKCFQGVFLALAFPYALTCGFGRLRAIYAIWAQGAASLPGFPGNFFRAAFYRMTLDKCSIDVTISFGSYFAHPSVAVGEFVSIGSYCVIGRARIGARTQIASHVQITSGRHQHSRDATGSLSDTSPLHVNIGSDCWVGASAVVMANVGNGSTIGAGAVVVKDIPAEVTAVGNPARAI